MFGSSFGMVSLSCPLLLFATACHSYLFLSRYCHLRDVIAFEEFYLLCGIGGAGGMPFGVFHSALKIECNEVDIGPLVLILLALSFAYLL